MVDKIIHHYKFILISIGLLTLLSLFAVPNVKVDLSFDKFFPVGDPELEYYEEYIEKIGSSEYSIILAVENKPSVFDSVFLGRGRKFFNSLDTLEGIRASKSIFDLNQKRMILMGLRSSSVPYLRKSFSDLSQDSIRIFRDQEFTQYFITDDSRTFICPIYLEETLTTREQDEVFETIKYLAAENDVHDVHLLGQKYLESGFRQMFSSEMRKSMLLSIGFIALVLFLLYRTPGGVVLPLVVVVISFIFFLAYLAIFQRAISIMGNLYPTIILIVGISDVIHICTSFSLKLRSGQDQKDAIFNTLKEIGVTNFITSLTTALGLLTLLTSSMQALRDFGIDAAVGVMITYATSILLVPSVFSWLGMTKTFSASSGTKVWNAILERIYNLVAKKERWIVGTNMLVVILSIVSISRFDLNIFTISSMPKNSTIYSDYEYFDKQLGGSRTMELAIQSNKGSLLNEYESLKQMEQLHLYIEDQPLYSRVISPVSMYRWAARYVDPGSEWRLPATAVGFPALERVISGNSDDSYIQLLDSTKTVGRLLAFLPDIGSVSSKSAFEIVEQWLGSHQSDFHFTVRQTGIHYLTDKAHGHRIKNLFLGLGLAIIAVSLIVLYVFRGTKYVAIIFIANVIPMIFAAGMMNILGLELRGSTSIVFAVGYVIAVDDSLHFLNRFRIQRRRGSDTSESIHLTILHSGKAIIMTSLILLGGFLILTFSNLGDAYAFGAMTSCVLLSGCLINMFLVPVLIKYLIK